MEEKEKKKENEQQQQPMGRNFWNFSRNYTKNKKGGKCLFEVNYKSTEVVNCNHIKKEGRFQCFYLMRCKYKGKKKGKEFFVFFLLKIFSHLKMYAPHFPKGTRWGVGDLCVAVVFVVLSRQVVNADHIVALLKSKKVFNLFSTWSRVTIVIRYQQQRAHAGRLDDHRELCKTMFGPAGNQRVFICCRRRRRRSRTRATTWRRRRRRRGGEQGRDNEIQARISLGYLCRN